MFKDAADRTIDQLVSEIHDKNKQIVESEVRIVRYRELINEIHFQASLVETSDNVDDAIMEAIKALEGEGQCK